MAIKEDKGTQCLGLRRRRDMALDRQVHQESVGLRFPHAGGMAHPVNRMKKRIQ
ncbi:hypothetical protein BJB45_06810 [Halomonas huangheensis]|uniref:Uncharacterized protein n=1 Tax=Halomonas huangheensis TaxID=1178482 RepID=W1N3E9_9GAMM|nr:hypothetical protein BJB45_06810 [Halomonas huangheensis]